MSLQELLKLNPNFKANPNLVQVEQNIKISKSSNQQSKPKKFEVSTSNFENKNTEAAKEFVASKMPGIKEASKVANKRNVQLKKADAKANKNTKFSVQAANNDAKLQDALWKAGFYGETSYEKAVDGDFGPKSKAALIAAEQAGYTVDRKNGTISIKANPNKKSNGLANMYEMTHAAQTGSMNQIPVVNPSINQDNGHAIYLHYPNFIGHSKNALKIAGTDLGEMIGDPNLPVGHSAVVLVDNQGNSNYYEYGRYVPSNGNVIGDEQRPTVKGGNWRSIPLPKQKEGENDSTYIARIQNMLPDTKTGTYQAMSIPSVDVEKATKWVYDQANNPNRKEYNIFNTCATGACNSILPFRASKINNNENKNNREGYSEEALAWAKLPFTTDSYAQKARKASSNIYIMNNK